MVDTLISSQVLLDKEIGMAEPVGLLAQLRASYQANRQRLAMEKANIDKEAEAKRIADTLNAKERNRRENERLNKLAEDHIRVIIAAVKEDAKNGSAEAWVPIMSSPDNAIAIDYEPNEVVPRIVERLELRGLRAKAVFHRYSDAHDPNPGCCIKIVVSGWADN
ncbi:MAG: hypothetical protein UT43_C0011G0011 [Parcubacteria group bacterium GW2011_GWC1_39_29]|nr:MAG: hypothetical protein UT43_C0011G0011 [Parcubacteria group bacterium GW2011_GWC1_39_29]